MAKVTRESNLNKARLENALKRGLIIAGQLVAQRATGKAPIDTGRLKRSITHGQPFQIGPLSYAIAVGTNVEYAPYMEFGTGALAEGGLGKKRHFPPAAALEDWARRHGIPSGFLVARAIARRGGLAPRPYLRPALQESNDDIKEIIARSIKAAFR